MRFRRYEVHQKKREFQDQFSGILLKVSLAKYCSEQAMFLRYVDFLQRIEFDRTFLGITLYVTFVFSFVP